MLENGSILDVVSKNNDHSHRTLDKSDVIDNLIDLLIWNLVTINNLLISLVVSSIFYWFYLVESNQHYVDKHNDAEVDPSQEVPLVSEDLKSVRNPSKSLLPFHFNK